MPQSLQLLFDIVFLRNSLGGREPTAGSIASALTGPDSGVCDTAIPLILDKDTDFITAMQKSYRVVTSNPDAMAVWAASIVVLTAVGIATGFVGFAVIFPVLGYATWHSYRELMK